MIVLNLIFLKMIRTKYKYAYCLKVSIAVKRYDYNTLIKVNIYLGMDYRFRGLVHYSHGGFIENGPHRFRGTGTLRRCGLVGVGMALL